MANSNPWFWGGKSRQQFEQELQKDAVLLHNGKGTKPVVKPIPKHNIEEVRARKNKLIAAGILKPERQPGKPTESIVAAITAGKR